MNKFLRRFLICKAVLSLFLWAASPQIGFGQEPLVTGSEMIKDRIAILKTNEPNLYYQVPENWTIYEDNVFLSPTSGGYFDLTVVLAPSYRWTKERIRDIKKSQPQSIFLPVPRKYTRSSVPFPDLIGAVKAQLSPDAEAGTSDFFYLRMSLSPQGYELLKTLVLNNTPILGYLTYQFSWEATLFETISDVVLNLPPSLFGGQKDPSRPWTRDLATDTNNNGLCDQNEICAFFSQNTKLTWATFYDAQRLNPEKWVEFCEQLSTNSATTGTWRLPYLTEVQEEISSGMWGALREKLFKNEWWWGTNTLTPAEGQQLFYWINVDSGNTYPLHRLHNASDRALCVREDF